MKVSCPSCEAKYNIADEKIKGKKVKVRCKSCGTQILVDGNSPQSSATAQLGTDSEAPTALGESPMSARDHAPANTWTVNFSDTDERSLTADEIADLAVHGQLSNEVFVWQDGMSDWQLVNDVPELAAAIAAKKRASASTRPASVSHKPAAASTFPHETGGAKVGDEKASAATKTETATSATSSKLPPAAAAGVSIGPIVAAPGSALAKKMASAKNAAAQKKSGRTDSARPDVPEAQAESQAAAGGASPKKHATEPPPAPKSAPEHSLASKAATKRQAGTHDLFAAVDSAGSEIDVDTSDAEVHDVAKATGARNENSVLFSLDALKSGMLGDVAPAASNQRGPAGPRKKAPGTPTKRLEDLMSVDVMSGGGLGRGGTLGGGGLLLSGNDALLAAPPPPPPKPEPKPEPVAQAVSGLVGSIAAPPKKRVGLFIGLAVVLVAVGAGGAFVALKASSKDVAPVASAASPVSATVAVSAVAAVAAVAAPSAAPNASAAVARNDGPDASAPSAGSSAMTPQAVAVAGRYTGGGKASPGTGKVFTDSKSTEKKTETKSAEPAAPSGAGGFSKEAAVSALSVAASQATVCKRPEGPWGSGRAVITFAPSGRVTTANVTGDPFGGTSVGGCVASVFRRAKIPSFSGDPVTVSKSFTIAP